MHNTAAHILAATNLLEFCIFMPQIDSASSFVAEQSLLQV